MESIIKLKTGLLFSKSLAQYRKSGNWAKVDFTFMQHEYLELAIVDERDNIPPADSEFWRD